MEDGDPVLSEAAAAALRGSAPANSKTERQNALGAARRSERTRPRDEEASERLLGSRSVCPHADRQVPERAAHGALSLGREARDALRREMQRPSGAARE